MRITIKEKNAIIFEAKKQFGLETRVILFGSRAKNHIKGGDIDLLIIPIGKDIDLNNLNDLYERKINFLVDLKESIDDQKIDVIIKYQNDKRDIINTALKEGIVLC